MRLNNKQKNELIKQNLLPRMLYFQADNPILLLSEELEGRRFEFCYYKFFMKFKLENSSKQIMLLFEIEFNFEWSYFYFEKKNRLRSKMSVTTNNHKE